MNYKNLLNIYFFLAFLFTAQPCDTFNMTDAAKPLSILFMFGASLFMCPVSYTHLTLPTRDQV